MIVKRWLEYGVVVRRLGVDPRRDVRSGLFGVGGASAGSEEMVWRDDGGVRSSLAPGGT